MWRRFRVNPAFSKSGWWYSYFEGDSLNVSDLQAPISLKPGEYRIYTSKRLVQTRDYCRIMIGRKLPGALFMYIPIRVSGLLYLEPLPEKSRLTYSATAGQVFMNPGYWKGIRTSVDLSFLSPGLYVLSRQSGKEAPQYVKVIRE